MDTSVHACRCFVSVIVGVICGRTGVQRTRSLMYDKR
jgi:hypothetical protein